MALALNNKSWYAIKQRNQTEKPNLILERGRSWRKWERERQREREKGGQMDAGERIKTDTLTNCCILTFDPAQNAIQRDALEGSDKFQWQLWEEIAWAEIG